MPLADELDNDEDDDNEDEEADDREDTSQLDVLAGVVRMLLKLPARFTLVFDEDKGDVSEVDELDPTDKAVIVALAVVEGVLLLFQMVQLQYQ